MEDSNLGRVEKLKLKFNKDYTEYWKKSVSNSIDGTQIAGSDEVNFYLKMMKIKSNDKILDLGCSYGRFLETLVTKTSNVYGIEPDSFAISEARKLKYVEVIQATAEKTTFQNNFFNQVFAWAVFDILNLESTLIEINRILKQHGILLFTGKNSKYNIDDSLALVAEKNAYLKNFPNNFTNLPLLLRNLHSFGFEVKRIFIFRNRGDFGKNKHIEIIGNLEMGERFYEYLLILQKTDFRISDTQKIDHLTSKISNTAIELAKKSNFLSVHDLFVQEGIS
jgi:ubiquinone/menaquinone biosynthesis C-methylase UbiE